MKKKILIPVLWLLGAALLLWAVFPGLTGDSYPLRLGMGIMRVTLGDEAIVTYARDLSTAYMVSPFSSGAAPLKAVLLAKGWRFTEQMGAGYLFEREGRLDETLMVTGRQFTRHFRVWQVPGIFLKQGDGPELH